MAKLRVIAVFLMLGMLGLPVMRLYAQTYDTISNWENITPNWVVWAGPGQVTDNPAPGAVNPSAHCIQLTTNSNPYNLMLLDMEAPADFDRYPRYSLLVLAPATGGDVVLKFENSDNTSSRELLLTPQPGQWTRLEFDFSGQTYENYTRMVIFFDFLGTNPDRLWYIDDVVKEIPEPVTFTSTMPIVVINTNGVDIPNEPKIPGTMGIIYNGPGNLNSTADPFNHYNGNIGIEIRGQSSQMFPKKSYSFETRTPQGDNNNVALLGMPKENDWVLYAPYTDKSMLRNAVTFGIGHKMDGYCTRTRFVEVIVNTDYKGIYVLMERIKRDKNRVNIEELTPSITTLPGLSGGYIVRVDKMDPDFTLGTDGWLSEVYPVYNYANRSVFQYYYPKADEIVPEQRNYIKQFITSAEVALNSSRFKEPGFGYMKYFDLPSFVDFMLLNEISKEVDKYKFSTYFFKENDNQGGKLFAGPAWDFNLGYGNVDYWPPGISTSGWMYSSVKNESLMMYWWQRLMEDNYFRDLAKTRWLSLRQNLITNAFVEQLVDSLISELSPSLERNYERWPILGQYVWPNYDWQNNTYEDETDYFRNFLFTRLQWMDNNMPGNALRPWAAISSSANKITLTLYGDYFRRNIISKESFTLNGASDYVKIQGVEYKGPASCEITLTTDASAHQNLSVVIAGRLLNTLTPLESNKLASVGMPEANPESSKVTVGYFDHALVIRRSGTGISGKGILRDMSGRKVSEILISGGEVQTIPLSLNPGVYIYSEAGKSGWISVKMVVL